MKEYFIQLVKFCGFCLVALGFSQFIVIKIEHSTGKDEFEIIHRSSSYDNKFNITVQNRNY